MHHPRIMQPLKIILYGVLILLSFFAQIRSTHDGGVSYLRLAPNSVKGWYKVEQSDTIPGSRGVISAQYQWTYDQASLNIWPIPVGMRLFSITYLAPFGNVDVFQNEVQIAQLTQTPHVRTSQILLPSDSRFDITFVQQSAQRIDDRILGFMMLQMQWYAVDVREGITLQLLWRVLSGIPLTTLVFLCLGWLYTRLTWQRLVMTALPLACTLVVATQSGWHAIAMQPLWQFVGCAGVLGIIIDRVIRRFGFQGSASWLLAIWVVSTVLLFTPDVQGDGVGYYAYIRSAFIDGDLQFANEFNASLSPFAFVPNYPIYEPTGYTINPWSIGPALLQVPFWIIGHGVAWLTNVIDVTTWRINGYSAPFVTMVGLSSVVAGLVSIFGMYYLLRRQFSQSISVFSTAFMFLASNLLYYAQINNNNVHSISTATVTVMFVALMAVFDRPTKLRWGMFGLSVGLIGIVYWVTLILCIFPAGVILSRSWTLWKQKHYQELLELWRGVGISVLTAVSVLALQSGVWYVMYDSLFTVPQGNAFAMPQYPRLWQMFFGDWYGLLWWTPALFIGIVGLFFYAKSSPTYGTWMVVAVWAYILYNASIPNWDGSSGFGFRRLSSIAPFVVFGVAYIVERTSRFRHLHVLLFAMLSAWTTRFALRYVEFRVSRTSRFFLNDLVVATFDPQIVNMTTLATVFRHTWLGIFWRNISVDQVIIVCLVIAMICGCIVLWYRPLATHWWGITAPRHKE